MDAAFKQIVEHACTDLRNSIIIKINSNIPPPNAESTLEKKKPRTKTLVDHGSMVGSITYQITDLGDSIMAEVGVFDKEIVPRALANEYGARIPKKNESERHEKKVNPDDLDEGDYIIIPERSFLRSTYDENVDRIMSKLQDEILDLLEKDLLK